MSFSGRSLLYVEDISLENIDLLFSRAQLMKSDIQATGRLQSFDLAANRGRVVALLFLEPSTRTRCSFEIASHRLGMQTFHLSSAAESSLAKGETHVDTLETLAAMEPDVLVVRYSGTEEMDRAVEKLNFPVINGGAGAEGHPTQALLDAFTIKEKRGSVKGQKVLFVGDVMYSRVAQSNLKLLTRMGAEVALCGPESITPKSGPWAEVKQFVDLKAAISWATVVMGLRLQRERHGQNALNMTLEEYAQSYSLSPDKFESFRADGLIMHPGPFVRGVDFSGDLLSDPRCVVRDQVTNGVYTRAALISLILGMEKIES